MYPWKPPGHKAKNVIKFVFSQNCGGIVTTLLEMNVQEDNDGVLTDERKRTQRWGTEHMAASKSWDIIQAFQLASKESSSLPPSVSH